MDLRHPQDDSGDLLLMIVMLIKTRVSGALQTCDGSGRRWQPYGSLRHRPDDSGDVLLMIRSKHPGKDRADEEIYPEGWMQVGGSGLTLILALQNTWYCYHDVWCGKISEVKKTPGRMNLPQARCWTLGDVLLMILLLGGGDSCVPELFPLSSGRPGSRMDLSGQEGACSHMDLRHPQDDSGDLLLTIVMLIKTRVSGALQTCDGYGDSCVRSHVLRSEGAGSRMDLLKHRQDDLVMLLMITRLHTTRVTGGIQTADGDGDSCVLDILPLGQEDACSRMNLSGIVQVDSGDVLLMILLLGVEIHVSLSCFLEFRKATTAVYGSLRHPQDDSGDLLLTMSGRRLQPYGSLRHPQDDSGDLLLTMMMLIKTVFGALQTCDGSGRRWQPYGSLRHRPDDSGDVLLMMSGRRWQPCGSLKHRQDDSGDVLLM
ncbi:hypothetical protein MUG91_G3736n1, partial [Manis pentadactyla]